MCTLQEFDPSYQMRVSLESSRKGVHLIGLVYLLSFVDLILQYIVQPILAYYLHSPSPHKTLAFVNNSNLGTGMGCRTPGQKRSSVVQ